MVADVKLVSAFGDWLEAAGGSPASRDVKVRTVLRFAGWHGAGLVSVRADDVGRWLGEHDRWTSSTRTAYVGALRSFFEFCSEVGRFDGPNPTDPFRRWPGRPARLRTGLESTVGAWCEHQRRRGLSPNTVIKRRNELRLLADFLGERSLLDADASTIEAFLDSRPVAARARYAYTSNLSAFYEWAVRRGMVDANPVFGVDRPRLPQLLPRPIRADVLAEAMAAASPRVRAMLCLAAFAGLRCQEIAGLDRADVLDHLNPPMLLVRKAKGRRERMVPVHPSVMGALTNLGLPRSGWVFSDAPGRPVPSWRVSADINGHLHGLGIADTAHSLRHFFGTSVYASSLDLRMTQELLGHSSPTTTAIYAAWNPGNAVAVVAGIVDPTGAG